MYLLLKLINSYAGNKHPTFFFKKLDKAIIIYIDVNVPSTSLKIIVWTNALVKDKKRVSMLGELPCI